MTGDVPWPAPRRVRRKAASALFALVGSLLVCGLLAGSLTGCRKQSAAMPAAPAPPTRAELESRAAGGDARALRELAFRDLGSGAQQKALGEITRAVSLDPASSDGYNVLGMVHASMGSADAPADFERAARLAPHKAGPRLNLGRWYREQKQMHAAAGAFETATRAEPSSVEAALAAGDAWREVGSSFAAKRAYRHALELRPSEPRAFAGLGEVLTNTGRFLEAREQLNRAEQLGDHSARTEGFLGLAYALGVASAAEADQAIDHLRKAQAGGETGPHIYYGLGLAYLGKRSYSEGEQVLREGLGRYPGTSGLHYTLADIYAATGRLEQSRAERARSAVLAADHKEEERYEDAIAAEPTSAAPYVQYARWLISRHEPNRAIPLLQQAVRLAPGDAAVRGELRRLTGQKGRRDRPSHPARSAP